MWTWRHDMIVDKYDRDRVHELFASYKKKKKNKKLNMSINDKPKPKW